MKEVHRADIQIVLNPGETDLNQVVATELSTRRLVVYSNAIVDNFKLAHITHTTS